jgi:uracil-DNA glycosylase
MPLVNLDQTAFSDGDPESKICIIGESPTSIEVRLQKPFMGPAGTVLDQCLHAAGIIRRQCYFVTVFPEQVKKNARTGEIKNMDGEVLWNVKGGFSDAGKVAAYGCIEKVAKSGANVIVPLGSTALSLFSSERSILKWRGSILTANNGRKMVPTIHPAAALRGQYLYRHLITHDLRRVRDESTDPEVNLPKRSYIIDPTFDQVIEYLAMCCKQPKIATDIEVFNHQVSCISFAPSPHEAICVPFLAPGMKHRWTEEQETEIWLLIAQILGDPAIMKINQNISFDIGFLLQQNNIITRGPLGDTMIAQHIVYPDFKKGLDMVASIHTREPYWKDDGKLWSKPWVDWEQFWIYNSKDSAVAFDAWNELEKELDDGYRWSYDATMRLLPPVVYMMTRGMLVDKEELRATSERVTAELEAKYAELKEVAEWEFNPKSPKQCQEYFYVTKNIKPYVNRSTGRVTTDDKAMARIVNRYNLREARLVQEIRGLEKLRGTYLEVGIDKDSRIRCSYNLRGTTTGRLSSSQTVFGNGMNMQNLHPEFKSFIVSE